MEFRPSRYHCLHPGLGLVRIEDPWSYFDGCASAARDLLAREVVTRERFEHLAALLWRLLATSQIHRTRLRLA